MADFAELLVVVFDGAKARFFKFDDHGKLTEAAEMQSGLHRFNRETVSDKEGRNFSSVGTARHAYEPKHDPHKQEKHDFVHHLVKTLDDAYDQKAYRQLIVVAPERSLGEFRSLASARLKKLVALEIAKELTHYSGSELEQRLRPHLTQLNETAPVHK